MVLLVVTVFISLGGSVRSFSNPLFILGLREPGATCRASAMGGV